MKKLKSVQANRLHFLSEIYLKIKKYTVFAKLRQKKRLPKFEFNKNAVEEILCNFISTWQKASKPISNRLSQNTTFSKIINSARKNQLKIIFSIPFLNFIRFSENIRDRFLRLAILKLEIKKPKNFKTKESVRKLEFLKFFAKNYTYKSIDIVLHKLPNKNENIAKIDRLFIKITKKKFLYELKKHAKLSKLINYLYESNSTPVSLLQKRVLTDLKLYSTFTTQNTNVSWVQLLFLKFAQNSIVSNLKKSFAQLKYFSQMEKFQGKSNLFNENAKLDFSHFSFTNNWVKSTLLEEPSEIGPPRHIFYNKTTDQNSLFKKSELVYDVSVERNRNRSLSIETNITRFINRNSPKPQFSFSSTFLKNSKKLTKVLSKILRLKIKVAFEFVRSQKTKNNNKQKSNKILYGKISNIKQKTVATLSLIDEDGKSIVATSKSFISHFKRQPDSPTTSSQVSDFQQW